MRADRAKQLLKNGVYRAIGETMDGVGAVDGDSDRTLRVLMYHKVNDLWPNPTTVPTAVFAEQMALLQTLGYTPVSLDAVLAHYLDGVPLPARAVLLTFDDGYRDNLENALPVLRRHGYPAVLFAPVAFLDDGRPLPHEETLHVLGVHNETLDWDELAELEAGGVRIESHGIGHRPLSELDPAEAFAHEPRLLAHETRASFESESANLLPVQVTTEHDKFSERQRSSQRRRRSP